MKAKKKFIVLLVICYCGISLVFIFYFKGKHKIQEGIYKMENLESYIELRADKTFHFILHITAGHSLYGDYSIKNSILTLHSESGDYEFYIKNNKIIFKEENNLGDWGTDLSHWGIEAGCEFIKAEGYFDEDAK